MWKKVLKKYISKIYEVYDVSANKNVTENICLGTCGVSQARKASQLQQNDEEINQNLNEDLEFKQGQEANSYDLRWVATLSLCRIWDFNMIFR